jgi:hypothetical protein
VARPPDGTIAKERSRTALFAYVAARLAQAPLKDDSAFFGKVGLDVNGKAGAVAGKAAKSSLVKWLVVDEPELDLDVSLLRFPPGEESNRTFAVLADLPGVRQLIQLGTTGEVIAIVVFDGARARRDLRASIEERIGVRPVWEDIERETFEPARRTWRELARKVARDEGLLHEIPAATRPPAPPRQTGTSSQPRG